LIKTDPHCLGEHYKDIEYRVDFSFGMQEAYLKPHDIYLPYAADQTVCYPEEREKKYDVCMIGLLYEHRKRLIDRLRDRGLNVYYNIGEIFDEYRERYNESKIALSWASANDTPCRFFEGMAMKLPVVANRTPDAMHLFQEGNDFLGFETIETAEELIMCLLNDEKYRNQIAENGYRAVQPHNFDARVETILKTVGLI